MEIGAWRDAVGARRPFDLLTRKNESEMTTDISGPLTLVRALNDRSRTRIGNPWTGSYAVSIKATDLEEAQALLHVLEELGVEAQLNSKNQRQFVAIYTIEALRQLLEATEVDLEERRKIALDELVRAREPIPQTLVRTIRSKRDLNQMSFAAIAHLMNEKGIVEGMGGLGWTEKKVRAAYRNRVT